MELEIVVGNLKIHLKKTVLSYPFKKNLIILKTIEAALTRLWSYFPT